MIGNELGRIIQSWRYSYGRVFIGINIGFCLVMTAALLLMKGRIIDIYNYDAATSQMLNLTLIAYALYTTPKMMSYVHICGILRSGGDTKFCMFCDLIGYMVCRNPHVLSCGCCLEAAASLGCCTVLSVSW